VYKQRSMAKQSPVRNITTEIRMTSILFPRKLWLFLGFFFSLASCNKPILQVDFLIQGALVFSGENQRPAYSDVGLFGDKIVFVGDASKFDVKARRIIDATGLCLSPGFIDPHTHLERDLSDADVSKRANLSALRQGVTTIISGNDGGSPIPVGRKLEEWERLGVGTNVGLFVGHGSVRRLVLGLDAVQPTEEQLEEMKQLVAKSMEEGAFGLSSGLFYAPASYAKEEEIVALAKVVSEYGGIYDTHMRDESSYSIGLLASVEEVLSIGRKANLPVHISHIKALGSDVWGKSKDVIDLVVQAQATGLVVSANQYPYLASKTSLRATVIPRWAEAGGGEAMLARFRSFENKGRLLTEITENIRKRGGAERLVFSESENPSYEGLSLKAFAETLLISEAEAVLAILEEEPGLGVISHNMVEEDLKHFMQQPWVVTGSDASSGHPRKFGSFARKIGGYAIKENWFDLPFAIHQSSGNTANILGMKDRGFIKEGFYADVCLFDPSEFKDMSSFESPYEEAVGMVYVFVNGKLAIDQREFTGELAGKALRHSKSKPK
jgi:N-acyl-D-amino-acid deacylase